MPRRRRRGGVGSRPHPRRPRAPRAAARAVHRRRRRHHDRRGRRDRCDAPRHAATRRAAHAHVPAAAGHVRAGRGHRAVGRRRASATSTSSPASPSRRSATPTPRSPTRSPSRPAPCCTSPTCSAPTPGPRWPRTLDRLLGGGGQVFFCQLRRRGQRVRHQAGPQVGRPRPPRRGQRLRLVPRPHARHAARHRPAAEARGVPAAARGLPPRGLERPRRARGAPSTRRWPPCCSSRCRARAACNPATAEYFQGVRRLCDERGLLFMVDEVQTGLGRTGRVVRLPALRRRCPTSSPWPRRSATACPSAPAGPGPRSPRPSSPATTPRPSAASRSPPPRPAPCCAVMEARGRARPGRDGRARGCTDALGRPARRGRACGASACCSPPSSTRASTPAVVAADALDAGLVVNAVTPTALRLAPPLLVSDDEIDEAVGDPAPASSPLGGGRRDAHFLEIDDLHARRAGARCSTWPSAPTPPPGARRAGRRPACSRSRRPAPATRWRWRWSSSAATRSRSGADEVGLDTRETRRGRRPHAGLLPRRHRRPGLRARASSSAWPRSSTVPVVNLLSDDAHPLQALADLLTIRQRFGDARRAARSPTSATATTWPGRWPSPPACSGMDVRIAAPPATSSTDADLDRLAALGGRAAAVDRPRPRRSRAPTSSTPTSGRRWARRTRPRPGAAAFEGFTVDDALMAGAAARRRLPALPARPPGEEVAAEVRRRARAAACGRQADEPHARRPRRCWPGWS